MANGHGRVEAHSLILRRRRMSECEARAEELPVANQQQFPLFECHLCLVRTGQAGHHAQTEGVMLNQIMEPVLLVEGVGDACSRCRGVHQLFPRHFGRNRLGRFLPPALCRGIGAFGGAILASSLTDLALNLINPAARKGRDQMKLNALAGGTTDSEMVAYCQGR